jgi:hypothetical protein
MTTKLRQSTTVVLVLVFLEVSEGGAFFVLARPVDAPQGASEELLSHLHREPMARSRVRMAPLSEERDRLRDHVVRGEYDVLQEPPPIALEDLPHAGVVLVSLDEQREDEACIEEDQSCGSP